MNQDYINNETIGLDPVVGVPTREELKSKRIKGWFAFFLFTVILSGFLSIATAAKEFDESAMAISPFLGSLDFIIAGTILVMGFYAVIRTVRRDTDAIFWLRFVLLYLLVYNAATTIVSFYMGSGETAGLSQNSAIEVKRGFFYPILWLAYLAKSVQVADIFPKIYRKTSSQTKFIAILLFALPLISYGIGYLGIKERAENWGKAEYSQVDMPPNFATDGHVKFAIPSGAILAYTPDPGSHDVAVVTKEAEYFGFVFSSPYGGEDESEFEEIRLSNRDELYADALEEVISSRTNTSSGRLVRIKECYLIQHNQSIIWRFIAIYDRDSRKTAYLSFYDNNESASYLDSLIESIQFK